MSEPESTPPTPATAPRLVALSEAEAAELRSLHVIQQLHLSSAQTAEAFLRARARAVAQRYGIDLSPDAPGTWTLDVDSGHLRERTNG